MNIKSNNVFRAVANTGMLIIILPLVVINRSAGYVEKKCKQLKDKI
jgi:hypothetical protein